MPKLWVDKKLYSVEGEVRDYVEKIEAENKRLKKVFDHPNHDIPKQRYLYEIKNAIRLLKRYSELDGGDEYALGVAMQLQQFCKKAKIVLEGK